ASQTLPLQKHSRSARTARPVRDSGNEWPRADADSVASGLIGNHVHLHSQVKAELFHINERAGYRTGEVATPDLLKGKTVLHIDQVNRRLGDVSQPRAESFERLLDDFEG